MIISANVKYKNENSWWPQSLTGIDRWWENCFLWTPLISQEFQVLPAISPLDVPLDFHVPVHYPWSLHTIHGLFSLGLYVCGPFLRCFPIERPELAASKSPCLAPKPGSFPRRTRGERSALTFSTWHIKAQLLVILTYWRLFSGYYYRILLIVIFFLILGKATGNSNFFSNF